MNFVFETSNRVKRLLLFVLAAQYYYETNASLWEGPGLKK